MRCVGVATRDEIERVREAIDLVDLIGEHVALQPRGREHVGLCPFHDDRRPSFAVVTHKQAAFYKCHACGAAGDCFRFVQEHLGKEFGEALQFLAERAGIELSGQHDEDHDRRRSRRAWLRKALNAADEHFCALLSDEAAGADARAAIGARGISPEMVEHFGLGCAGEGWNTLRDALCSEDLPDKVLVAAGLIKQRDDGHTWDAFRHRLIFPIHDESGQPIAFGGRILAEDEEPKYLNSCEHDLFHKSRTLYGLHQARRAIMSASRVIVAEGYTDVIACHQAGICNVVATLGTAMTTDHARILARMCDVAVLLFDGDEAGQRAAERAIPLMVAHDVDVRICVLPEGMDPDQLLRQADGVEAFHAAVEQASDAFAFMLDRLEHQLQNADGLSGRQGRIETFIDTLARDGMNHAAPLRRAMLVGRLAELAGVASAVIDDLLRKADARHLPSNQGEHQEAFTSFDGDIEIAPALRRAEFDVLAVRLHLTSASQVDSGGEYCVLADPAARRIAQGIATATADGTALTMQALLDQLPDDADRSIASELYFEGRRMIDGMDGDAAAAHATCEAALTRCRQEADSRERMNEWKASADRDPQAAAAVIEHLRGLGPRAAAMPRPAGR
ncbi:MAG: DNA primase [Phycisphaerales bacterium]|jgi:DNA primase|nr:DNA primase [Phycisphaerales bacterium]